MKKFLNFIYLIYLFIYLVDEYINIDFNNVDISYIIKPRLRAINYDHCINQYYIYIYNIKYSKPIGMNVIIYLFISYGH